jgi:hypothetical protein
MLHWTTPSVRWLTAPFTISRLLPWLAGFTAFMLYAYTAAPGIVTFFDDTLEFQTVAPTFGITHPTGYPLYTLIGGLWTRLLPFGTWAGRLNLFSAFCAAIAVGLIAAIASRLTTERNCAPNPWAGSTAAIVYALGRGLCAAWRFRRRHSCRHDWHQPDKSS